LPWPEPAAGRRDSKTGCKVNLADLFAQEKTATDVPDGARPLADRLRPTSLDGFFGQEHLLGPGKPLRLSIEQGKAHSMVFWGPPGTGKTTLARIVAHASGAHFIALSAVMAGVKDVRAAVQEATQLRGQYGKRTILFLDEVHRFNKSQQDAFLPYVEDGTLTFIGATTENPSFELNNALLSRARVYVLKPLDEQSLRGILQRALDSGRTVAGAGAKSIDEDALELIVLAADGDARRALNLLELAVFLRSDLGIAQIGAWLRSGCDAVLDDAHDRWRLRPPVPCPAHDTHGLRRHWQC
jgi:putative ATPase